MLFLYIFIRVLKIKNIKTLKNHMKKAITDKKRSNPGDFLKQSLGKLV